MQPLRHDDPPRIDKYVLDGRLGAGGMGTVYLGRTPGHHLVAIKVIHRHFAEDESFRRRFASEVECARKVKSLYTAAVVDADPDPAGPTLPWLATEFVPGVALDERIGQAPLDPDELRTLAAGLAEALSDIHDSGTIHRDLKPSNILLASTGPRVIDFGIAQAVDAMRITQTGFVVGSAHYVAPERYRGDPSGAAGDIFSLGIVLAYAASGRLPFADGADSRVEIERAIRCDEPDVAGLTGDLRDIVLRCLRRSPEDRPTAPQILLLLGHGQEPTYADNRIHPTRPTFTGTGTQPARPTLTGTGTQPTGPTLAGTGMQPAPTMAPSPRVRHLTAPSTLAVAVAMAVIATVVTTILAAEATWPVRLLVALLAAAASLLTAAATSRALSSAR